MGKLLNSLLVVLAIELSLNMFVGMATPFSSLLSLIFNINLWSTQDLITKIMALALTAGITGIIAGNLLGFKSDFLIFAGLAAIFLSYGMLIMNLGIYLNSTPYISGTPIALIIIAPMVVIYLYTILKFWRGWD